MADVEVCQRICQLCPGNQIGSFMWLDILLFVAVLVVSAGIGVYYMVVEYRASKSATSDDILMGGRDIGIFPIAMSLMASFMSAITVLGTPTEMYNNNTSYWIAGLAMIPTVVVTNHVFLPFFHGLNLASAYEYLEKRFNKAVRIAASTLFILNMLLYMGVVLYAPALALNSVTGLPLELCIVVIGVVCTFYTALGGLKAVVWSDTFQTFIVMAGLVAVIAQGAKELGGIDKVWSSSYEGGRIFFVDWSGDPTTRHSIWALVIGSFVGQLTIYAANQTMIQRYLAIKETKNSQRALYISLPLTLILSTLVCIVGLVIYASYRHCDPLLLGHVHARDQLLPFLVMDKLTFIPGLSGLFVACLFSASLSSISSGLNALAIVILEDILRAVWEYRNSSPSVLWQAHIAKIVGFLCGGMVIALAFLSTLLGQTVLQIMLSIFGMVGGPLLGLFITGIFMPYIDATGALVGLVVSTILTFWVGIGGTVLLPVPPILNVDTDACDDLLSYRAINCTSVGAVNSTLTSAVSTAAPSANVTAMDNDLWIYHISYLWYGLFAVIVFVIIGSIASIISGIVSGFNEPDNVSPEFVHSAFDRVCCYLSVTCRRVSRYHAKNGVLSASEKKGTDGPWTISDSMPSLQPWSKSDNDYIATTKL